ncbi:hypothetical protein GpartN1_g634.t1 [Galdieria partita]|uniref:Uncharacterized protein n=1 Tax=Galdieria partita TaxID=83374 RepID=A0A9C7UMP6_9RHOD|nr:hypothetical protein GpartN1_g634.t1 [Galdieria partita]
MGGHSRKAQYPKQVWHPFGGWFPHPRNWKRNTNIATLIMALIAIPIVYYAEKHTTYYQYPYHKIPWRPNLKTFDEDLEERRKAKMESKDLSSADEQLDF